MYGWTAWRRLCAGVVAAGLIFILLVTGLPAGVVSAQTGSEATATALAWTARESGTSRALYGVAHGGGRIVAVGRGGTVLVSADGEGWTPAAAGTAVALYAIAYGDGRFVAVGDAGTVLVSADGRSWTAVTSGTTAQLRDVIYGDGLFVAVGEGGTLLTSRDGKSWTARSGGSDAKLYAVAYGAGRYVAVGATGAVLTSSDGAAWVRRASGTDRTLSGVAYGGGRFLAVGEEDTVLTSADGETWRLLPAEGEMSLGLWQVAYGDGRFVGVGGAGSILTSADGAAWARYDTEQVFSFLNDVAYVGGGFIAVGDSGTIRTSRPGALELGDPDRSSPGGESDGEGSDGAQPADGAEPGGTDPANGDEPGSTQPDEGDETDGAQPDADGTAEDWQPLTCTEGVVAGSRIERRIAGLTIRADSAAASRDGWEELCGNITLNEHLKLDGTLRIHRELLEVEGSGTLYVETHLPEYAGTIRLMSGDFRFNGDLTELIKESGLSRFDLYGVEVEVAKLRLLGSGVEIAGTLKLPKSMGSVQVSVNNLRIVRGEFYLDGQLKVPKVRVGKTRMALFDVLLWYQRENRSFVGEATLVIPEVVGLEGQLEFRNARLERVGIGISEGQLAIDASGLFITSVYGEVAGLSEPPFRVTGRIDISGGPEIAGFSAIQGEDLTFTVDATKRIEASGRLVLVEYLSLLEARASWAPREGFFLRADVDIEEIIQANMAVKIGPRQFHGQAEASIRVPEVVPVHGGSEIAGVAMNVGMEGLSAELRLNVADVTARMPWRGDLEIGVIPFWRRGHEVPLLASTVAAAAPGEEHTFTMPEGMRQVFVVLRWDQGDADFTLTAPDGTVITPQSAPLSSETARYDRSDERREALYWLRDPLPGTWTYSVTTAGARSYTVELIELEVAPEFTLTAPAADVSGGGPVRIAWTTDAPAGSTVSLYYARSEEEPGWLIASGIDAALGAYTWTPTDLPSGEYAIYAILDDGATVPVKAVAPGRVGFTNPGTPAVPTGLKATAANGAIYLEWEPNREPDLGGYRLHLLDSPGESVALGQETAFTWRGLETGRTYQIAISAYSADGLQSALSAPVTVYLPEPDPPGLEVVWPEPALTNRERITVTGQIEAGASGTLYRGDEVVAEGLTGSFSQSVTLLPGRNRLRLVAVRPDGDAATEEREYLYDDIRPQLTVENLTPSMTVDAAAITVRGRVEITAELTLNGRAVPVADDGTYSLSVPLSPGPNEIELIARDAAGNETAFRGVITSTAAGTCGSLFPDVGADHPACVAIEQLAALGVIGGYPDGTFRPERSVTRAEFAKMLVVTLRAPVNPGAAIPFADARDHWAAGGGYLQAAVAMGAISGFPDGTFRPDEPVTRAQVIKIAAAATGLTPDGLPTYGDVRAGDWFAGWAAVAQEQGLIGRGAPTPVWTGVRLEGNAPATRAEAAMVLVNLLSRR